MAKIVYRQMPAPRELPQQIPAPGQKLGCKSPRGANVWCKSPGVRGGQIPAPRAKARMQKPQGGGGQIFGANPRGAREGVMDEIDTCIISLCEHVYDGVNFYQKHK